MLINDLPIDASDRIGEEGRGFRYLLDGLNPERIFVGATAVGIGKYAVRAAARYASERIVFGRPIGVNQSVQHPLAKAWIELEAAELLVRNAAALFDVRR